MSKPLGAWRRFGNSLIIELSTHSAEVYPRPRQPPERRWFWTVDRCGPGAGTTCAEASVGRGFTKTRLAAQLAAENALHPEIVW